MRADDSWFFEQVNRSRQYPFPEIRYALSRNPHIVLNNDTTAFRMAQEG